MWKVGTGDCISFWFDNWIDNRPLIDILDIPEANIEDPTFKVQEFILPNRTWNTRKLSSTLNDHPIINKILGIDLPCKPIDDSFCWGLSSN